MELGHKKPMFGGFFTRMHQTEQQREISVEKAQNTEPFSPSTGFD
jgi:hypothetical protein